MTALRRRASLLRLTASGLAAILSRLGSAQVAQLVEHVTENHGVDGSIPPLGTTRMTDPAGRRGFVIFGHVLGGGSGGLPPAGWNR